MAGVMQFSLGLATQGFLANLGTAGSALNSFALKAVGIGTALAGAFGFAGVVKGTMDVINKGGELNDLSAKTGAAVDTLYKMQRGFELAGVAASKVPDSLIYMQKALGGVNDQGEPTGEIFRQMGLDIGALKQLKPEQQLDMILGKLRGMSQESAVFAATKIFSRGGAGDMLQLARNAQDYATGMQDAAQMAALFQRSNQAFDRIGDTFTRLKHKSMEFFGGIAEAAAPGIQKVLDWMNKLNTFEWGQAAGKYISALGQAFGDGKLGELLGLTLKYGFDRAVYYGSKFLFGLGEAMIQYLSNLPQLWMSTFELIGSAIIHTLGNAFFAVFEKAVELMRKVAELTGNKTIMQGADTALAGLGKRRDEFNATTEVALGQSAENLKKAAGEMLKETLNGFKFGWENAPDISNSKIGEALKKLVDDLAAKAKQDEKKPGDGDNNTNPDLATRKDDKPWKQEFPELQKIGAIFSNRGILSSTGIDRVASNTSQTNRLLVEAVKVLKDKGAVGFSLVNI